MEVDTISGDADQEDIRKVFPQSSFGHAPFRPKMPFSCMPGGPPPWFNGHQQKRWFNQNKKDRCKGFGKTMITKPKNELQMPKFKKEFIKKWPVAQRRSLANAMKEICKSEDVIKVSARDIKVKKEKHEMTEEEYNYVMNVNSNRKMLKKLVRLSLLESGLRADLSYAKDDRMVLLFSDIQNYMLRSQLEHMAPGFGSLRWLKLKKMSSSPKRIFLIVEGVSIQDYLNNQNSLPNLSAFKIKVEFLSPHCYGGNLIQDIISIPLSGEQKRKQERKFGSLNLAVQKENGAIFKAMKNVFPVALRSQVAKTEVKDEEKCEKLPSSEDKFSRVELLLSPLEMMRENFPLPLEGHYGDRYNNFLPTRQEYATVTSESPMWAIDCEMCMTTEGSELTRISIINENHEPVFESLVKPYNPIVNYLTRYSGITESLLTNVNTRLEDVQERIQKLCPPDVIFVGHSLGGDLKAMKMMHPYVIDSSVCFNMSGERQRKSKLKYLAEEFLSERIQCAGVKGHDSIEDAVSSLKLIQLKLKHSFEWGDAVLSGPRNSIESEKARRLLLERDRGIPAPTLEDKKGPESIKPLSNPDFFSCLFTSLVKYNKTVSLISKPSILDNYVSQLPSKLRVGKKESRLQVTMTPTNKKSVEACAKEDADFVLAHLKFNPEKNKAACITKVDRLVGKLIESSKPQTLINVILAGSEGVSDHGLCLVNLLEIKLLLPKKQPS